MSAHGDPRIGGRTRLSFASADEVDTFVSTLEAYERGEITPEQWKSFRLLNGTYGQRQDGFQMVRVKIPQGILEARQLRALASVAEKHSRGFGHVTTRQNLQFHFIQLADVEEVMRTLTDVGLTMKEACGNSVRNITACPYSGTSPDEAFDVTPYSEALTRHLLGHPLSASLPRKFKIGFESCPTDHAFVSINDIGFTARLSGGQRGFRVTVGGGTATLPRSGSELIEFAPADEILEIAEAVIRVFHAHGDRQHRQRNRMKFLIQSLGWDGWVAQFRLQVEEVRAQGRIALPFDPERPPVELPPDRSSFAAPSAEEAERRVASGEVRGPGIVPPPPTAALRTDPAYFSWRLTSVRPQKQAGYSTVIVGLPLGDVTARQLDLLADLSLAYGDGTVRTSPSQNLFLRWVRNEDVRALHDRLAAAGLARAGAETMSDVTSCPGAETCRLAVTQSRGLGRLVGEFLHDRPDLVAHAPEMNIKVSGCPNGCGQHHIAGIGFQGTVRRHGASTVPHYLVLVGGGIEGGRAHFGRVAARIPARRIPVALERLLGFYKARADAGESAPAFFRRVEKEALRTLLADLEELPDGDGIQEHLVDLGETTAFVLDTKPGECAS